MRSNYKKEYKKITEELNEIQTMISYLEKNNDIIKKYIDLRKNAQTLRNIQKRLFKIIKTDEFDNCNHVLVYTKSSKDERGRICKKCGCIKCGLDETLLDKDSELTFKEEIIQEYLKKNFLYGIRGKQTDISCDLSLGKAIYSRIKEENPLADDELILKYFRRSLGYIREVKVNDSRKINRAKRLSLKPDFNSWNSEE